jgi:tetratricopeptide (TPR) repeat protein
MFEWTPTDNWLGAGIKKAAWILTLIVLLTAPSHAAKDPLKRGMQLYKKHQYEQAIQVLYGLLAANDSDRRDQIYLGLGMSCLANASLYRDLHRTAIAFNREYLMRLLPVEGPSEIHLNHLYLGKTLLEAGERADAIAAFKKFLADKNAPPADKDQARIELATAYYLQGQIDSAHNLWSQVKARQPQQLISLAAAYSRVGLAEKKPLVLCRNALRQISRSGRQPSIRITSNLIYVYTKEGSLEEGFQLIRRTDLKAFFQQEIPAKNKVIRYYDSALLGNLSLFYGRMAVKFFEKANSSADQRVKGLAQYYLAESYALLNRPDQSNRFIQEFISVGGNSSRLKNRIRIQQAFNHYQLGNADAANRQIASLLQSEPEPDLMAEILLGCIRYRFEVPQVVINASAMAQRGEGRRLFKLNFALGKYYLWKHDYSKAVFHMEAGRDKSNKNRIEFNDPLMLVNLAEAYYRSKQFSEALEIFFEMSKQFPAVRQIQDTLQGVYIMEQKSAGDVKIL